MANQKNKKRNRENITIKSRLNLFIIMHGYKNTTVISFLVILLFSFPCLWGEDVNNSDSIKQVIELTDKETAAKRAIDLFGVSYLKGLSLDDVTSSAEKVVVKDSTSPFISKLIDGKIAWKVVIECGEQNTKDGQSAMMEGTKRYFELFLDPDNGQLLKVVSQREDFDEEAWHIPSAEEAENDLLGDGEKYLGLPEVEPTATLSDAFEEARDAMGFYAYWAEKVVALYVMRNVRRTLDSPDIVLIPVWEIYLYGIETVTSLKYPELPFYVSNFRRITIDATTGKLIKTTNTPHPNTKENKEEIERIKEKMKERKH